MKKSFPILFVILIFSALSTNAQTWLWAKQGSVPPDGVNSIDEVTSINRDAFSNVYETGYFIDSVYFDSFLLKSSNTDIFLVKYDSIGNVLWANQASNSISYRDQGYSVQHDMANNIYITGMFQQSISFGTDTLNSPLYNSYSSSVFLVKYSPSGNIIWAKQSTGDTNYGCCGYSISTDRESNLYVSGAFSDMIVFGKDTLKAKYNSWFWSIFLAKFDSAGNVLWVRQSENSATGINSPFSANTDNQGNTYVTGRFSDTVSFGAYTLKSKDVNVFLVKYDSAGNVLWAKQSVAADSYNNDVGFYVLPDNKGGVYVTGSFSGIINFDTAKLNYPSYYGSTGAFLCKYNSTSGKLIWAKQTYSADSGYWAGRSIAMDDNNLIYWSCGGTMSSGSAKFEYDSTFFTQDICNEASVIMKLDSNGNFQCGSIVGAGGDDFNCLAVKPNGNVLYFGGDAINPTAFGNDSVGTSLSNCELTFLAAWLPCGEIYTKANYPVNTTNNINLYPNPSNGRFAISVSHSELVSESHSQLQIYNMLGENIYSEMLNQIQHDYPINLSMQPTGLYLYRIISAQGEQIATGKFIIEK